VSVDVSEPGPWLDVSREHIRELFDEHLRTSAYPEYFDGVARGIKPRRDRRWETIRKRISVDPADRGRTLVPCNLCNRDKFKQGGRLIRDELGWLYIIGPDCGEKYYGEEFREDDQRYEYRVRREKAFHQLVNIVDRIPEVCRAAEALSPHVEAATEAHRSLIKITTLFKELRRAHTQQNNWLQVDGQDYVLSASGQFERRGNRVDIAPLRGASILEWKCTLTDQLSTVIQTLGSFGPNAATANDRMQKADDEEQLADLAKEVQTAIALLEHIRSRIAAFQAFFSEENFRAIDAWARDHRCPIEMKVACWGNKRVLAVKGARRQRTIDVTELISPLSEASLPIRTDEVA